MPLVGLLWGMLAKRQACDRNDMLYANIHGDTDRIVMPGSISGENQAENSEL